MQNVVADAPDSSSAKNVKPPVKSKKKGSPLDEIRKDPDALYALVTKMFKEKEATDSEDERSSQASITKDPYYPYNQEWFGHDEEDADYLAKDWLEVWFPYLSGLHNGQSNVYLLVMVFWKDDSPCFLLKRRFSMIPKAFSHTMTTFDKLLLFTALFTIHLDILPI